MESNNRLIGKYLKGEASPQEKDAFKAWLDQNETNREAFSDLKRIWDRTGELREDRPVNVENAWNRFVLISSQKKTKTIVMTKWIWRAAAVLIIGIGLSYLARDRWLKPGMVQIVAQDQKRSDIVLPDGTTVWLNRNSRLSYPERFEASNRDVYLEGEAFFEVIRNETKPFIITTPGAAVKVLGTSFNVKTEVDSTEVTVATGKVAFYLLENKSHQVVLNANDKGIFRPQSRQLIKTQNIDPNFLAWKTGKLVFENATLEQVVKSLSSFYNKEVELGQEGLSGCRINTVFDNQPLEEVMEEISLLLGVSYKLTESKMVISGQGCKEEV